MKKILSRLALGLLAAGLLTLLFAALPAAAA
jgi:hypothetical protein